MSDSAGRRAGVDRRMLFGAFFFAALALLIWQLVLILTPFLTALMGAATLVLVFYPVHRRITMRLGARRSLAAVLSTVVLLLVIVLPVVLMGWVMSRQASALIPAAQDVARHLRDGGGAGLQDVLPERVSQALDRLEVFLDAWGLDVKALVVAGLDRAGDQLSALAGSFVLNALTVALNLFVVVFGIFFFLRDGSRMVLGIASYVPMERVHVDLLLQRLDETFSAVVRGVFITATVHGVLAGAGFAIAGLRYSVLLGCLAAMLALIPVVGPALIWIPTCAWVVLTRPVWASVFLIAWAVLVIGLVDILLKPALIQERTKMPTFLAFFGIVGGLEVYGVLGIFIGPLVIALLLAFAAIYREEFQRPATPT